MFLPSFLLLFVSSSSTFPNFLDLRPEFRPVVTYIEALRLKNKEVLLNILDDKFRLYDCHTNVLMNRESLLKKVDEYDSDFKMDLHDVRINDFNYYNNTMSYYLIADVFGITKIVYLVNEHGKVVSEAIKTCFDVQPIITSVIDDPGTIAKTLIHRYYSAYMRKYDFDNIIHPEFTITQCDGKVITINKILNIFHFSGSNILAVDKKEMKIRQVNQTDQETIVFNAVFKKQNASEPYSVIQFKATLVDGKYRLISEHQVKCDKAAEISDALDESTTKIEIIRRIGQQYTEAIRSRDLEMFREITLKTMTVKLCTESSDEFDLLMLRDDYFIVLLTRYSKYNSTLYGNVKNIEGSLLKGEFKWALDNYSEVSYKADARSGKLRIFSEERRECLTAFEIEDYNTYLRQKMQELIYEFVSAVNLRNKIKFNALTTETFKITTLDIRAQPVVKNVTNIVDSYPVHLPKLVVINIPIVEGGIIKFSAKAEDFENQYTAIKIDDKFLLASESTRKLSDSYVLEQD